MNGIVLLLALASSPAGAAVIIGNLPSNDGAAVIDLDVLKTKAMGFTMGSQSYTLDSVSLRLRLIDYTGTASVQLWSNDGGNNPGVPLATLNNPVLPANGTGTYLFTPSSPFALSAGNTYWLVVSTNSAASDPSELDWLASNPDTNPIGAAASHFGVRYDADGPPPTGSSSLRNSYQIDGTLVPEPASAALAAAGLLLLTSFRRLR